ncbi:hypothetical protein MTO96_043578 [Rhipicephalus appendiculatus]
MNTTDQSTPKGRDAKEDRRVIKVKDIKTGRLKTKQKDKVTKGKTVAKTNDSSGKKKEAKGSSGKQKKDVRASPSEKSLDIKMVFGDIKNKNKMETNKGTKKEKKQVRHSQSSSTDVRVLLYDPPLSGFARALRDISRRG